MPSRGLAGLLVALAALAPARAAVKSPETFTYAITGDIDSLDPHWAFDGVSQEAIYQVYEGLIAFKNGSTDEFQPLLSTVVPSRENGLLSKDGLRYAFPLRKGVRFHDGSELTPEDARYSLLRFLLTDRASGPSFLLLEPLLGVQSLPKGADGRPEPAWYDRAAESVTVEGGALVVRLKKPYAPLLSILAAYAPVVSRAAAASRGGWDGRRETWRDHHDPPKEKAALHAAVAGTGPFKLERWDRENRQLILSRHDGYWRKPARLKYLVFRTVAEPSARRLMLLTGDADAAMMERQFLPQVAGLDGVSVTDDLPFLETHNAFVMNFKVALEGNPFVGSGRLDGDGIPSDFFADLDVRKGLAHAFDYDAYIRDGYRGKGARARGPIPKGVFGYDARGPVHPYDQERAERHFRRALGGKVWEKGFRFTVTYMEGRADRHLACLILKRGVEALNPRFKVDVRGILWSTWLSAWSAGRIPMANVRWHLDFPDPHNAVVPFLHSEGYYAKVQGYSNPRADREIELAKSELDPAKRRARYRELQAIAYHDAPQIYTLDTYFFQVNRSWLKGWTYNPILLYGYWYPAHKEDS